MAHPIRSSRRTVRAQQEQKQAEQKDIRQQAKQQASQSVDKPQNAGDLKLLLRQYGSLLTPENRTMITELIRDLENGADQNTLRDLALRMQQATKK